ncbi:MAG: EAL domain-containing protein [Liquorilactobacillus nagelii]|jgi:EAL domain-containing protein (putative c-di-GMP-specific phosphodiesterase class I)|uniref:EAL domain-containing protein n=1 Tax=Liquorilactobacillus nagelii TaxID=82688 RepID=UPI00070B665B|nr:EAL domain-containing protein [Liquorilactobacillus nagelii]MCI1921632.1 EAL domain-containing protein [Liquorilactobacillus nagelii]MCI1977242.1 EAL domain-containing protein [Liquorilactobacillus nagelii]QYH55012.1 EAL domain-containing protein [Liquorilactobacillus nagelii DSM 13675]
MEETFNLRNNQLIASLSYELQPIVNASELKISDYEFLLRSKKDNKFPLSEFNALIQNEKYNSALMHWLREALLNEFKKDPAKTISINFDPQQLAFPSTTNLLCELSSHQSQLIIEITEQFSFAAEQKVEFDKALIHLCNSGYKLAFDDLGSGQNTLELLLNDLKYFKRIKLSLLKFKQLDADLLAELLTFTQMLAEKEHLELVVEGIDCAQKAKLALDHGISLQQGFWWRKLVNNHQINQLNSPDKQFVPDRYS